MATVIICEICNTECSNRDKYKFISLCPKCDKTRYDLMHRLDIDNINPDYELHATYKIAEHVHDGTCEEPVNCKINIKDKTFTFSILKSFNPDVKKNGSIIDLFADEMLYYRWPNYKSDSLSTCKCEYGSTLCILINAKIVKKVRNNIYKSLPNIFM